MALKPRARKPRSKTFKSTNRYGVTKIRSMKYSDNWNDVSAKIKKRDGNKCARCPSTEGLETHHIIPVSKGGHPTSPTNLITLCKKCHNRRHRHKHRHETRTQARRKKVKK